MCLACFDLVNKILNDENVLHWESLNILAQRDQVYRAKESKQKKLYFSRKNVKLQRHFVWEWQNSCFWVTPTFASRERERKREEERSSNWFDKRERQLLESIINLQLGRIFLLLNVPPFFHDIYCNSLLKRNLKHSFKLKMIPFN